MLLDGTFLEGTPHIVRSGLPIAYRPDAPEPVLWLRFLNDLLYPEDIPTLQEYLGCCLIPSSKGQRMMVIQGNSGVKIVDGEEFLVSAVMHADEKNRAMSEALGEDVYHYHLHVVDVPVVEKQILWTKRCKDKALVGTVKETEWLEAVTEQLAQTEQALLDTKAAAEK